MPCSNPPALTSSPALSFSLGVPLTTELPWGRNYWEWTLQLVWVRLHLRVCLSATGEILKSDLPVLSSVHRCGNFKVLVHELWPLTGHSFSPLRWLRRGGNVGTREKPHCLPTVNVLFMDLCTFGCDDFSTYVVTWTVFLRILYNIYMQYDMNWFFFSFANLFSFVSYLIVFNLAWFVTIIHNQTCLLDLF